MLLKYDIIVVGAGHAGCEAAAASANLGSKVLLITMDLSKIAQMSCNPAIGGIAKGQIVREIDALGGYTGIVTDDTMIQFRMLNKSKGPAMWSPRAQSDRHEFSKKWRIELEGIRNIDFWQDMVDSLIFDNNTISGVKTRQGVKFYSKAVILTNGTFLNGLMHIGKNRVIGGRDSENSSIGISEQLAEYGIESGKMKTGTPARIDGRTIDFSKMLEQKGDEEPSKFSFLNDTKNIAKQESCYITYTNENVHDILREGFEDSPLYNGTIQGIGPRYCPSIEDKIVTFADRNKHQLFLEPEGRKTIEYYINGFSSSLAWDIQIKAINKIYGLENAKIFRPGYAIEYDYFSPTQLKSTLESKFISNLFFAGQINGTTGYEEAGAQGLMAGINAHLLINEKKEFVLKRDEAYIGVLIDDLVTKGVDEPYRMFTSRAEYRILLRQDNADIRLTEKSYKLGLATEKRYDILEKKTKSINEIIAIFNSFSVKPEEINKKLKELKTSEIKQKVKLSNIILRPQVSILDIASVISPIQEMITKLKSNSNEYIEAAEILMKYSGYIDRERKIADKLKRLEHIEISENFDYNRIYSLSTEARQKLTKILPRTIGQASRISGVSPSDINVLLVFLGR
ncbi:MAG: tRNA uridine-5-carboxymethylaminomethyl(34) synthesis enzyme MnmG [Bacteroidetes bacterium]|jgi:tRNA uridine 5-carboxymethylaminomethyl modification enzyme|nr:tRNA uridine-5-carboxymethylaminomethyl(34) synthesis enzyme MnmG [Bacteroidota bacterium]MBT6687488.1 tRNA uridine-5-carboxymethylaminomethyl(34) synthesis enzyme MnmG [Bacteroidota bacterium]MBT7142674.1 tRNA uridine-5-carboxymethylaminomethyl(34) synthesis enzyme MnmG [Bacteroidota bacterium]MBT7491079.1 tRNA uridine-5-carboxymethylaminomethyl(34) synthesis enzyme MnmG [Bacteroidota bacterium]